MRRLLCLALLVAACGDDGSAADGPPAPVADAGIDAESWGVEDLRGACAQNTRSGEIIVADVNAPDVVNGNFSGKISTGVEPNAILTPLEQSGECRIYRKENYVCDLPCGGALACGPDGLCIPRPLLQDVGVMQLFGAGDPLTIPNTSNQYNDTLSLPNPPVAPGDKVRVTASGSAEHEAFELRGVGVPVVEVDATVPLMQRDTDFSVTWDTTGSLGDVWIRVIVDQHGNSPVSLICVAADDGEVAVDASLVNAFLDYGITGVPNYTVERRTADHLDTEDGCLELRVLSARIRVFDVEGHTPCTAAMPDCPDPLECNLLTETCE